MALYVVHMLFSLVSVSVLCSITNVVYCKGRWQDTLQLVQIVYRHGQRTPVDSYPTDPYNNGSFWPDGWGQLTNQGKLQQYHLGHFLREYYKDFLTQDPREVYVRSSGVTRCLESAACNLASLYPPEGHWVWNKDLKWQPIPIQTMPTAEDGMLNPQATCPEAVKEHERIVKSPEGQKFLEEHKTTLAYASKQCGCDLPDWRKANWLYDTLKIERQFGLKLPEWTDSIWNDLQYIANLSFYWDYKTKQIQRLRAGLILQEINKNLQNKVNNEMSPLQRLFIYSTHDTLVAALLSSWDVYDKLPPPYCATVIIELHKHEAENYAVRLLYKNGTDDDVPPHVLTLPNCQEYCPLGHYFHHVRDLIPEDWRAECGLEQPMPVFSPQAQITVISLGGILILVVITCSIMAWYFCRRSDEPIAYQRVPTN